ncbi:MAG TPA: DUF5985 family protein [Prosthecobacter sp.]|nr:DUF5985 family protein [Prosthecobacter sp.]
MIEFLAGALTTLYLLIAICFLKFWKRRRDRLFLFFALAFGLFALNQIGSTMIEATNERSGYIYTLRVLGYLLILYAIVEKNAVPSRK